MDISQKKVTLATILIIVGLVIIGIVVYFLVFKQGIFRGEKPLSEEERTEKIIEELTAPEQGLSVEGEGQITEEEFKEISAPKESSQETPQEDILQSLTAP